jgi:hypothetical protein
MDLPIQSHDIYFHLRILLGVVLGLGLTRMLAGISKLIQHPGQKPLFAAHLLWVATVLIMAIHFWWFEFGLIRISPWHFELYVFVLFYAFLFFLMASLLFPDAMDDYASYEEYFLSRRRWFFGLLAASVPIDLIDTLAKGPAYFRSLGPEYPVRLVVLFALCVLAALIRNRRFQIAAAALYLAYFVSWILRFYRILE